jgi:serine protease Do
VGWRRAFFVVSVVVLLVVAMAATAAATAGCGLLSQSRTTTTTVPPASTSSIQPGWTISAPGGQLTNLPNIADVVAKVKPSVVAINVEVTEYDLFGRPYTSEAAGSGWIIDKNGIIVTNNHVVEGATKISVSLDDGRTFDADVKAVATDPVTDLAVVKIPATNLPAATVGVSSRLRVGDWVVAIGNSLGQGIRATVGVVSQQNVSVQVDGQTQKGLIETDAAINPGNSGGPLVDLAGEVIGITSVKIAEVGVEGVGFAISTDEARPIIEQLVNSGFVQRAYLGIGPRDLSPISIVRYSLGISEGALVGTVGNGSPAAAAGLRVGDVITEFAGKPVKTADDLLTAIREARIGETVSITYWRGATRNATTATLTTTPTP